MRATINIDDKLLEKAQSLTGTKEVAPLEHFRFNPGHIRQP